MNLRNCMPFLLLLSAGAALADAPPAPTVAPSTVVVTTVLTSGEIRNVDRGNQRLTIRHGDIENLGMPGMTMVFRVKPPATIDNLKPGDKIRFHAEREAGSLIVTEVHTDNPQ